MQPIIISNIKLIQYFDNERANKILYKAIKKLMRSAIKHYGNETLMLLNTDNRRCWITSQNNPIAVDFTPKMIRKLNNNNEKVKYAVIHNHPLGGTFSYMDIVQFLKYPRIKIVIACSNDCKQYFILFKTEKVDDLKLYKIAQQLDEAIQQNGNGHDSFIPILNKLISMGIDYAEHMLGGQHEETI